MTKVIHIYWACTPVLTLVQFTVPPLSHSDAWKKAKEAAGCS